MDYLDVFQQNLLAVRISVIGLQQIQVKDLTFQIDMIQLGGFQLWGQIFIGFRCLGQFMIETFKFFSELAVFVPAFVQQTFAGFHGDFQARLLPF